MGAREQPQAEASQADQQVGQGQAEPSAETEQDAEQQIESTGQSSSEQEAVDEPPPEPIVGVHLGVRSEGRVLGDPTAPILIVHFGDFT